MSELPGYAHELLKKIAASEGFTKYTTNVKSGSNHGDNFMGVLTTVQLRGIRIKNGKPIDDELNLLFKFGSPVAERRKEFQTDDLFFREMFAYEKLLPAFAKFQRDKGISDSDGFFSYPKFYASVFDEENGNFLIVMDDLRPHKYAMWPKKQPVPLDHVKLVIQEIAKYHGVSIAMKHQRPVQFKEFENLSDLFNNMVRNASSMFHAGYDMALTAVTDVEHIKILQDVKENLLQRVLECVHKNRIGPFGVIGHGDCWNNNQLFKYENEVNKRAASVCLIDWQVVRYASPALDLLYYIFSATDKDLRDKEYKNLLKLYHSTLSKIVKQLGSNPDELFPYDQLEREMKKHGKYAIIMCPVLLQIMLADAKDISNMDDLSKDMDPNGKKAITLVKSFDKNTQIVYNKRVRELLTDIVKYDLYWN